jgi:hypothetical protein
MVRVLVREVVLYLAQVEHHDVSSVTLAQFAAAFEVEGVCRQGSGRAACRVEKP